MLDLLPNRKKIRDLFSINHLFKDIMQESDRMMKIDIKESESSYIFDVELPGVAKEEIKVSTDMDTLTISVQQETIEEDDSTMYLRKERHYGSYSRSFSIPDMNPNDIRAKFENGLLTLIIPKKVKINTSQNAITID